METQEIFKSKRHNVFTEEIDKFTSSSDDNKRMQSIRIQYTIHGKILTKIIRGQKF